MGSGDGSRHAAWNCQCAGRWRAAAALCYAEGQACCLDASGNYPPAPYVARVVPAGWDTWSPWREGTLNVSFLGDSLGSWSPGVRAVAALSLVGGARVYRGLLS